MTDAQRKIKWLFTKRPLWCKAIDTLIEFDGVDIGAFNANTLDWQSIQFSSKSDILSKIIDFIRDDHTRFTYCLSYIEDGWLKVPYFDDDDPTIIDLIENEAWNEYE